MGFGVWGLGFGVWGLGFGVWGLGFGVWGLGFGARGLRAFRVHHTTNNETGDTHATMPGQCSSLPLSPLPLGSGFRV